MSKILLIDSSGKGSMSVTKPLVHYAGEKYLAHNPKSQSVYRDLLESNIQPVNEQIVQAFYTPPDKLSPEQKSVLALSEQLLQELFECDTYVFGVPMYNFSIPGVFKLYIDQIVRAGKTFTYDGGRPAGLLKGKKLLVVTASGGDYGEAPMKEFDFLKPYLRAVFGFIGIENIEFISVSGRDPETIAQASEQAKRQIDRLVSDPVLQAK